MANSDSSAKNNKENVKDPLSCETLMFNTLVKTLTQAVQEAIEELYPQANLEERAVYDIFTPAPNLKMGHLSFACFPLAKALRQGPPQIATALANHHAIGTCAVVEKAVAQGPYLNFFLKRESLGNIVIGEINSGEYFEHRLVGGNEKWMIEYSQPNTHKILHVGHMRNLCLGNALVRMCRFGGVNMTAVTYPGDVGTHVAKCLWYLKKHNKEDAPETEKGAWLGEMYTKANTLLEEERGTEKEEQNRLELTEILKQLHDQNGEYFDLWQETKEWSVALMKESYDWADVTFDRWFWESEMDAPSLAYAKELLDKGFLKVDDGAVGMDLNEDKLGFCLMIKSDGTGLYATKDVELARKKFEEFGIDKNIYIVDDRQAHHFNQVFKVLEKVGFEQAKKCYHLKYAMVELPDGGMSSRKGNIVPLMDLASQMEAQIKEQFLNKYLEDKESGWTQKEVNETAKMIANGAIKYGMTRVDNNRKIIFSMEEWLKLDGETGPYLQYVHARIASLCRKLHYNEDLIVDWELLTTEQETALMVKLMEFNDVVASGISKLQTMHLCGYLYDLGKLFNSFYAECPIGKAENETLGHTRLALAHATGEVMREGLALLGIPAPDKM
jgi:arginyl-tRNA synthetase